jgi:hypothetical protein
MWVLTYTPLDINPRDVQQDYSRSIFSFSDEALKGEWARGTVLMVTAESWETQGQAAVQCPGTLRPGPGGGEPC